MIFFSELHVLQAMSTEILIWLSVTKSDDHFFKYIFNLICYFIKDVFLIQRRISFPLSFPVLIAAPYSKLFKHISIVSHWVSRTDYKGRKRYFYAFHKFYFSDLMKLKILLETDITLPDGESKAEWKYNRSQDKIQTVDCHAQTNCINFNETFRFISFTWTWLELNVCLHVTKATTKKLLLLNSLFNVYLKFNESGQLCLWPV